MEQEIYLPKLKCKRCGYEWIPRIIKKPKQCPKCHSPYWDKKKWKGIKRFKEDIHDTKKDNLE